MQWQDLSWGVAWPEGETDHSPHFMPTSKVLGYLIPRLLYAFTVWFLGKGSKLSSELSLSIDVREINYKFMLR
jgi:hypothetical protein